MNTTHDYTKRGWGHDFFITEVEGESIQIGGWGHGIKCNDYLIIPNVDTTTRYQITKIEYKLDPNDMWFATAKFASRESNPPKADTASSVRYERPRTHNPT